MSFSKVPNLSHGLVRLEQLTQDHVKDLSSAVGDLWQTWYTPITTPDQMSGEIERRLQLQQKGTMAPFVVIEPKTNRAMGMTTYMNIDEPNRRLEIGSTWISAEVQRTGLNQAMKLLMLGYAFEELDCIAVEFRTHWFNFQSRAAIANLGAKQDGVLRSHMIDRLGNLRDTVVFSITASEWPTVKHNLISRVGAVS